MRAHIDKTEKASTTRARMFIRRDLAWLEGFPLSPSTWIVTRKNEAVSSITLNGQLLSRTQRTIHMLRREFPRALPRIVGDVSLWIERRKNLIEHLKPVVHNQQPLPLLPSKSGDQPPSETTRLLNELRQSHPQFEPLLQAFLWHTWTAPDDLEPTLEWLKKHATFFEQLLSHTEPQSRLLAIRLRQLAHTLGDRRVEPILQALSSDILWHAPIQNISTPKDIKKAFLPSPTKEPKPLMGPELMTWLQWVAEQDQTVQKRAVTLFALVFPQAILRPWTLWWNRARKSSETSGEDSVLKELQQQLPPPVPTKFLTQLLYELPLQANDKLFRLVAKVGPQLPELRFNATFRLAWLHYWFGHWVRGGPNTKNRLLGLIKRFHNYAQRQNYNETHIAPWKKVWRSFRDGIYPTTVDTELLWASRNPKRLDTFFCALDALLPKGDQEVTLIAQLSEFQTCDRVVISFSALKDIGLTDLWLLDDTVEAACALAGDDPVRLVKVIKMAEKTPEHLDLLRATFKTLNNTVHPHPIVDLLWNLTESEGKQAIMACAHRISFLSTQKQTIPPIPEQQTKEQEWIAHYPPIFHDSLNQLANLDPAGAKTAARILGKSFPHPSTIKSELNTLRHLKTPTNHQKARLNNLEERLNTPPHISSARAEKLRTKLRTVIQKRHFEAWREKLEEATHLALMQYLNLKSIPSWLKHPRTLEAILPTSKLKTEFQKLTRQLIQARIGEPPWDLRDRGQNRLFIQKMRDLGVVMEPWMTSPSIRYTTPDGHQFNLCFEADPIEIMHMGRHFGTCLAPGSFNYFSAITNAVDINKQVLFARDENRRVVGRMLVCLTNEGGLIPFAPYTHSDSTDFTNLARKYLLEIAHSMKTLLVKDGEVSTLLAPKWYDDGSFDLKARPPQLVEGSLFRKQLKKLPPESFLPAARRAIAPLKLNELSVPILLNLPEVKARPELINELMPIAQRIQLPLWAITQLITTTMNMQPDYDSVALASWLRSAIHQHIKESEYSVNINAMKLLNKLHPVWSLQTLRTTQFPGARHWENETRGDYLMVAADAHERLKRPRKAKKLYELALKTHMNKEHKHACNQAIETLVKNNPTLSRSRH